MQVARLLVLLTSITISAGFLLGQTEVLFSPTDKPTKRLLELIQSAKRSIHAAVYMITDKIIADALIEAKIKRGIDVQIVTDKITYESSYGKGKQLQEKGIPLFIYADTGKRTGFFPSGPIMHHKFAIFDNTKLWTGSFNWTASANRYNQENVVITDERATCIRFQSCFENLKGLCQRRSLEISQNQEAPPIKEAPTLDTLVQMIRGYFRLPRTA